jgi:TetR/AcrR family transcriptional repressor of nem operon
MAIKKNVKEIILQSGSALIYRKGYHGTGIKEITDSAGIPKGSFYNYFNSKEHFAISALDYMGRASLRRMKSSLTDASTPPLDRIVGFFTKMVEKNIHELKFKQGCFIGNLCQEMADVNEAIGEKIDSIFRKYTKMLSICLSQAQKSNDISKEHDVDILAEFIFNSWEGALLRMKASRNAQPLTAFLDTLTGVLLK